MSTHITSHYLPFREVYSHTCFPNLLVINFPIVLLQVADHPTKSLTTAQDWYRLVPLTNSISRQREQSGAKFCPLGGLLTTVLLECSRKGHFIRYLSILRQCLYIMQNHLQTRLRFLFLSWPWNTPQATKVQAQGKKFIQKEQGPWALGTQPHATYF